MTALGNKPHLRWIDKRLLFVDPEYQRKLDGKRSQKLISHLGTHFTWAKCGTIIVTPEVKGQDDRWLIIDGQHRHAGAMRIDEIKDLPCLVIDAPTQADQAEVFIDLNSQRVNLSTFAIFHAKTLVGDPIALKTVEAAKAANVTIMRYPLQAHMMKAGATLSITSLVKIVELHGQAILTLALQAIRKAWPERGDALRSRIIVAVANVLNIDAGAFDTIVETLAATEPMKLEIQARSLADSDAIGIAAAIEKIIVGGREMSSPSAEPEMKASGQRRKEAAGSAERKRPFQFDRSRPAKAKEKPAVVVPSAAKVRRFEPGQHDVLVRRTFEEAGIPIQIKQVKTRNHYWIHGKQVTQHEFYQKCNTLRVKQGKEPLQWVQN